MKDRGIALLTGLVLLAAVSLLALSAASGAVLQRNMAINHEENEQALQNAEIAQAYALAWLNSRAVIERESSCETGCLLPVGIHDTGELPARPELESTQWWRTHAVIAGHDLVTNQTQNTPDRGVEPARWLIEEVHFELTGDRRGTARAEGLGYYRITSRGSGRNARSVAVIETMAARPWDGDFQAGNHPPDGPATGFCTQFDGRYDCGRLSWRQRR